MRDEAVLARVRSLAVPPAWKHVWVSLDPHADVQARGVDAKGRVQYRYSALHTQVASRNKFYNMLEFAGALPRLRQQIRIDLRRRGANDFTRMTALAVRLLDAGLFRIGSPTYAKQNQTYGLTTLKRDHVSVKGNRVFFDFVGKEHLRQQHTIVDAQIARKMRPLLEDRDGDDWIFQTQTEPLRRVLPSTVNGYIHSHVGTGASAKMFRTWGATVIAAAVAAGADPGSTRQHRDKALYAFDAAAKALGNTPTMARSSYVHPTALLLGQDRGVMEAVETAASKMGSSNVHAIFHDEELQEVIRSALQETANAVQPAPLDGETDSVDTQNPMPT